MKALRTAALTGGLAAALLGIGGCAHGSKEAKVEESWVARVPEDQLGSVKEARSAQQSAEDDVQRAEVARDDAEQALKAERQRADAAKKEADANKTELKAAQETGQQDRINAATQKQNESQAVVAAAEARVKWFEKEKDAKAAEVDVKNRKVDVAKAQLEFAEYQALKNAGDTRVKDMSEANFRAEISKAESKQAEAEQKVSQLRNEAKEARAEWRRQHEQLQGIGGGGTQE